MIIPKGECKYRTPETINKNNLKNGIEVKRRMISK